MSYYVYLIAHVENGELSSPIKVGVTKSLDARLRSLKTGNPKPLAYAFAFEVPNREIAGFLEGAFHHTQSDARLEGEWFNMSVRAALARMCLHLDMVLSRTIDDDSLIAQVAEASGLNAAKSLLVVKKGETLN